MTPDQHASPQDPSESSGGKDSSAESASQGSPAPADQSSAGTARHMTAAAASSMRTRDDGTLDVMGSIGGVRGLLEASLPAAGFLVAFVLTEDL
ncbi:MAG TPA: DUF3159 domain-containing protein, partial [Candidatus Nesterenkonia stercoripullorum]|nr:DUF3159 domain-containing protein [Candidatus Nesterenkonia stercoripullorum]